LQPVGGGKFEPETLIDGPRPFVLIRSAFPQKLIAVSTPATAVFRIALIFTLYLPVIVSNPKGKSACIVFAYQLQKQDRI